MAKEQITKNEAYRIVLGELANLSDDAKGVEIRNFYGPEIPRSNYDVLLDRSRDVYRRITTHDSVSSSHRLRKKVTNALNFEEKRQMERLRQARWSFNVAMALVVIGTLVVLAGVILLLRNYTTAGIVSSASGVVSNITSAVLFKFNKDANDRLDKIKVTLAKIESYRKALDIIDKLAEDEPVSPRQEQLE